MTSCSISAYEDLLTKILKAGVEVSAVPRDRLAKGGAEGDADYCESDKGFDGRPVIQIGRDKGEVTIVSNEPKEKGYEVSVTDFANGAVDPQRELELAAHEFGHHLSREGGKWSKDYLEARERLNDGSHLSPGDEMLIRDEETRAWDNGRKEVESVSRDASILDSFDVKRKHALKVYEDIFDLRRRI